MGSKIRLGIVGAGRIAIDHLEVLQALPDVEVVAITSRTKARAQELADKYAIPLIADDIDGLMMAEPSGLLILVSTDQMFKVAFQALTYGVPVFLEKPPGMLPGETWKLAEQARTNGTSSLVGFNRRYYSVIRKGREIIDQHGPLLGVLVEGHERMLDIRRRQLQPEHILSTWIYANATHTIDLFRMFGGEVARLQVSTHRWQEALGDQFAAVVDFDSGALGTYVAHWLSPGGWRIVLYGRGVTVEFKPLESGFWTDENFARHEIDPDACDVEFKPGFYRQMEIFRDIVAGKPLPPSAQDLVGAYQTMHLAERLCADLKDSVIE